MKYAAQIAAFETKRAALVAANDTLMEKAATDGTTFDAAQTEEFDGNQADIDAIDAHLKRLKAAEKSSGAAATPVEGGNAAEASASRGGTRIEVKGANLPKGTSFTRYAMALARSKGNLMQAAEIAKGWADSTPEVETVLKAAVAAGTTTDTAWAKPLVEYQNMTSEFAELLRPATIIGRSRSDLAAGEPAPAPAAPDDLSALREQYHTVVGKKPYHGWDAGELRKRIAEAQD